MTIAAMKQALEALEASFDILDPSLYPKAENMVAYSITALRAAIAEQEKCEPVAVLQTDNSGRFLDCIYRGAATPADQFLWQEDKRIPRSTSIRLFTHPAPVPAGWQLVPVEPTERQWEEGKIMLSAMLECGTALDIGIIYKAMLAAAPKPGESHD
jgi:hypothetical protein